MYNFVRKWVRKLTENKTFRSFLTLFIVLTLLLTCSVMPTPIVRAEEVQIGYVNGSSVYVRTGPGTDKSPITQLSYVQIEIIGSEQGTDGQEWKKIRYQDIEGYMHSKYVTVLPSGGETNVSFEEQLAKFPESYHSYLKTLHSIYPNWSFEANYLPGRFDDALDAESVYPVKLVPSSYAKSLRSMGKDAYNWSKNTWNYTEGSWVGASREIIAYFMDPRNFLNTNDVYMFLTLDKFDPSIQTREGVSTIIKNTFLANGFSDTDDYNGSYLEIIMAAAASNGISPYTIASTIKQEQGSGGTSSLISGTYPGYEGYYNFFNVGATGGSSSAVIKNGLEYAKKQGWNSRSKAIIGGAKILIEKYFAKGLNTYYYKNFDVLSGNYSFQYAQNIYDSRSKGANLRPLYISNTTAALHFRIPVYKDMWDEPAPKPAENDKKNNYYFTSLGVSGFTMYTEKYSLSVTDNKNISYAVPEGASYIGPASFELKKGSNTVKLTVKAETGATNVYTLNVTASKACTLTIGVGESTDPGPKPEPEPIIHRGDVNNDNVINGLDSAFVRLHILKRNTLAGEQFKRADVDGNGVINGLDSAYIRLHILGRNKIEW